MTARRLPLVLALAALAAGCGRRAPTSPAPPAYGLETYTPARPFLNLPATEGGPMPATLGATGAFADVGALVPTRALVPYDVNLAFWSGEAHKRRWIAMPDGPDRIHFSAAGEWAFPTGTVFVKHFERPDGTRLGAHSSPPTLAPG